jgi:hypothetical protein
MNKQDFWGFSWFFEENADSFVLAFKKGEKKKFFS